MNARCENIRNRRKQIGLRSARADYRGMNAAGIARERERGYYIILFLIPSSSRARFKRGTPALQFVFSLFHYIKIYHFKNFKSLNLISLTIY